MARLYCWQTSEVPNRSAAEVHPDQLLGKDAKQQSYRNCVLFLIIGETVQKGRVQGGGARTFAEFTPNSLPDGSSATCRGGDPGEPLAGPRPQDTEPAQSKLRMTVRLRIQHQIRLIQSW